MSWGSRGRCACLHKSFQCDGLVAQCVERPPLKREVDGANPSEAAKPPFLCSCSPIAETAGSNPAWCGCESCHEHFLFTPRWPNSRGTALRTRRFPVQIRGAALFPRFVPVAQQRERQIPDPQGAGATPAGNTPAFSRLCSSAERAAAYEAACRRCKSCQRHIFGRCRHRALPRKAGPVLTMECEPDTRAGTLC